MKPRAKYLPSRQVGAPKGVRVGVFLVRDRIRASTRVRNPLLNFEHLDGIDRPVLKHGPRSALDGRVLGLLKPEGEMKVNTHLKPHKGNCKVGPQCLTRHCWSKSLSRATRKVANYARVERRSRIVAMSFCEPRSWTRVLSS